MTRDARLRLLLTLMVVLSSGLAMGQETRLIQVKLYTKTMQPVSQLEFSFDRIQRYTSNDKGVAIAKMAEADLPPKDVIVYNEELEAESWNYSKGVLEVIIRDRTSKTMRGIVKNQLNEPVPGLQLSIGEVTKLTVTSDVNGEFEFKVPLDFNTNTPSAYGVTGYVVKKVETTSDLVRLFVEKQSLAVGETPLQQLPRSPEPVLVRDSSTDIASFYNYLRGVSLSDLNDQQQEELNNVFYELITYYEDSLKRNIYKQFGTISETSKIEDDLDYLIQRAEVEQNIASEFNRLFAEKIGLINKKLAAGGEKLAPESRAALIADIERLDAILRKNETLFQENQSDYRQMLKSISTNLLQISDLEEQLDLSEQQRREQQQMFEQKVLFYSTGLGLLIIFSVVLAYFLARIKKQKDKTQKAYKKINDLNEHLEELVEERTALLEMTNAELDTFFYKSAHNLRRPLLTILGLSQIAALTLDEEAQKLFEKASETASSMDTMLRKLIMVSHINYPSDKSVVNFEEIVDKIIKEFKPEEKHVTFVKKIRSSSFVSYPMIMDIILRNLLENSFEFSAFMNDKPHVELEITENTEGLSMVVSDNGMGIEDSQEEKVWRMFYVANENSSGNGLGLYIAQKAVKTLNGTIGYLRTEDHITQFTVTIPGGQVRKG